MGIVHRLRSRRRRSSVGAAAVEFAIVALMLFTLLLGLLQYALYFWSMQSGSHAAREAARQAAVGALDCTEFDNLVLANAQGEQGGVNATRTYYTDTSMTTEASDDEIVGGVVKVTVEFNSIDLNFPFIPFINDGKVSEQGVSRVENKTDDSVNCS
jgi:Flp pilus assembly protein TadG